MNGYLAPHSESDEKEFLYSVLNLPTSASDQEIRERYRSLSILFHPDKQHGDESSKATAEKRFLEIQKAYEVLSDPFLREVYNTLGNEGLKEQWPDALREKPPDELRNILLCKKRESEEQKAEDERRSWVKSTCFLNASSLFVEREDLWDAPLYRRVWQRLRGIQLLHNSLGHDITHTLNDKTRLRLSTRLSTSRDPRTGTLIGKSNMFGIIQHQFTPHWMLMATTSVLRPGSATVKTTYRNDETQCTVQTHLSAKALRAFPPSMTISLSQRLYRRSPKEASLTVTTGSNPSLILSLVSPSMFDFNLDAYSTSSDHTRLNEPKPVSYSGFGVGTFYTSYSLILAGISTGLKAEWGLIFSELAVQVKLALEYGLLTGLGGAATASWTHGKSEVATSVGLNQLGVILRLDVSYVGQRMSIPITLSQEFDMGLALCTAVVPSTAFVLCYHYILRPRRRAQRLAHLQATRKTMEDEKSHVRRELEETTSLLKEVARKHTQIESSKGGLVVLEAKYGAADQDENARELIIDVTVPLQALVHHSQVNIPGHRTKSGIQGFYDPAPGCAKVLMVRYSFRGRAHYAEIPDYMPVVLPLADHLVE